MAAWHGEIKAYSRKFEADIPALQPAFVSKDNEASMCVKQVSDFTWLQENESESCSAEHWKLAADFVGLNCNPDKIIFATVQTA